MVTTPPKRFANSFMEGGRPRFENGRGRQTVVGMARPRWSACSALPEVQPVPLACRVKRHPVSLWLPTRAR